MKHKITRRIGSGLLALAVISGGTAAVLPQVISSTTTVSAASQSTIVKLYKDKLEQIKSNPDKYMYSATTNAIRDCVFTIADVNSDGVKDLIMNFNQTAMAGMHMRIWTVKDNKLVSLGTTGSFADFYKNGYVRSAAYHNHGASISVWPYTVYKYDNPKGEQETYGKLIFNAYSVDKASEYPGNTYSESLDKDKDGVIYYIDQTPMTKSEFIDYTNKYIPDSNQLNLNWKKLRDENISSLESMFSLTLNKTTLSLGVNETYQLTATQGVKWRTSAPKILTVNQSGMVNAVGTGTAWITAKADDGKEKSCKITVKKAPAKVSLSKGNFSMGVGETFSLSAVLPDGTASAKRTFRTSNSSIIKMTKTNWTGSFKAVKPGTAWVTVRLYNGVEKSCKITVKPAPAKVYVNKKTLSLKVGQTAKISAYLNSGAACATRTFRTSNSSIVKMTKTNWEGQFKAVKSGTAWVTVRTYNGKEASCKITVTEDKWKQLYKNKLKELLKEGKQQDNPTFELLDLDKDGTPELIYSPAKYHVSGAEVYTVVNNKLKKLNVYSNYGFISYNEKNRYIGYFNAQFGVYTISVSKLNKGNVSTIITFTDTEAAPRGANGIDLFYEVNKKRVSKSYYTQQRDKYLNLKWISVGSKYSLTAENIERYVK